MKKNVTIAIHEEKLAAMEMYLPQKNTTLTAELDRFVEQLYSRAVPQNVRDFIDMRTGEKPLKKSGKQSKSVLPPQDMQEDSQ